MTAMAKMIAEQALMERFRRGDDSAFDGIVQRHAADVAALANRLLGWPQDIDDVVQDVFLAAFMGLRRFRGDCGLRTWLFTITVNMCRRRQRRRVFRIRTVAIDEDSPDLCAEESAERAAVDTETFARVRRTVRALPTKYREVVVLRYLQGLETSEMCELLGITANAMQVRLTRAREQLRQSLGELIEEKT
jgi:RNA polymerase sigma-70 factor (ECF subfamily)